jgi:hypothetical protein
MAVWRSALSIQWTRRKAQNCKSGNAVTCLLPDMHHDDLRLAGEGMRHIGCLHLTRNPSFTREIQ